jgi:hypothetical protein
MRWIFALLATLVLTSCGAEGEPTPPAQASLATVTVLA